MPVKVIDTLCNEAIIETGRLSPCFFTLPDLFDPSDYSLYIAPNTSFYLNLGRIFNIAISSGRVPSIIDTGKNNSKGDRIYKKI